MAGRNTSLRLGTVLGFVCALGFLARSATPCSCFKEPGRFLYGSGTELPADALGVPWWAGDLSCTHTDEFLGYYGKGHFLMERMTRNTWIPVPFGLIVLEDSLVCRPRGDDCLLLVCPQDRWRPGESYRVTDLMARDFAATTASHELATVTVHISPNQLPTSVSGASVHAWGSSRGLVRVSASVSCSESIDAGKLSIGLVLPPEWDLWAGSLLVSTQVDGHDLWRPAPNLCEPTPPGMSWQGWGAELLYCKCGPARGSQTGLSPGNHVVRMIAWLPGTDMKIIGTADVELSCP